MPMVLNQLLQELAGLPYEYFRVHQGQARNKREIHLKG